MAGAPLSRTRDIEIDGEPGYVDMWHTPHKWTDVGSYFAVAGHPLGPRGPDRGRSSRRSPGPNRISRRCSRAWSARAGYWQESTDYVVGADGVKVGILQPPSQIHGYDKLFTDFALNPDLAHALLGRISATINEMYRRYMATVGRHVQVVVITDDQGTQKSLMVSPRMFRTFIKPYIKSLIETIKAAADVKVLMHCDGAIVPILPDLIEIGVDIINPVQTVVVGLEDTYTLKEKFGDRITFHGGLDVQQVVPNATPEGLRSEVGRRIYDLGRGGGYILAPCHNISFDVPPANVLALFDARRAQAGTVSDAGECTRLSRSPWWGKTVILSYPSRERHAPRQETRHSHAERVYRSKSRYGEPPVKHLGSAARLFAGVVPLNSAESSTRSE